MGRDCGRAPEAAFRCAFAFLRWLSGIKITLAAMSAEAVLKSCQQTSLLLESKSPPALESVMRSSHIFPARRVTCVNLKTALEVTADYADCADSAEEEMPGCPQFILRRLTHRVNKLRFTTSASSVSSASSAVSIAVFRVNEHRRDAQEPLP